MAWFIHFLALSIWNAFWQTYFIGAVFDKISAGIIFFFFLGFSFSLFGGAIVIQSVCQTTRGANGLALVIFFLSYQFNTPFDANPPPEGILYLLSIFPTIVLLRMVKLWFIYQYQTEGLAFGEGTESFDTYSVVGGLLMLFLMGLVYSVLGLYLDQVVPMEFGVSKPWNFLCKKQDQKVRNQEVVRLDDNDVPDNKDPDAF